MANQREEDLELAPQEAGVAFRAEMAATNLLLGYWKHLVAVLVLGLLTVLVYEQYQRYVQRSQRELTAEIANAERGLPVSIVELPQAMQIGEDEITAETLSGTAAKIEAVAHAGAGPAAVEGLLKAAELYRLAGDPAKQRAALEAASAEAEGVLKYAAVGALANLDLEEDRGDDAVARLRTLMETNDGYLAQQAALDLGMALEHLGRGADAQQVYGTFLEKWPDSTRAEDIRSRRERLGGEG